MDLCACVSEERGDGEGLVSQELSLTSDTRRDTLGFANDSGIDLSIIID